MLLQVRILRSSLLVHQGVMSGPPEKTIDPNLGFALTITFTVIGVIGSIVSSVGGLNALTPGQRQILVVVGSAISLAGNAISSALGLHTQPPYAGQK